ncbi:uncharacterized protein EI90DRAFT_3114831 [Cantharellus anzutake]|uniref:uncharacterized protein n=1 Tax=Cantharellus anzutake TaxID=1750568 RepID=UPI001905E4C2|nr:uncharacterized protein EI90DRAFT_3114831 [Cantharellus anzutake]KAF8344111.1 hypothetical protein EI90DRAFT_3114831 [Cantharellus anzutake]
MGTRESSPDTEMVENQPYLEKEGVNKITEVDLWIPNHVSLDASNLIQRSLCKNPEDRLTLSEVKNHRWISRYQ